VVVKGNGLLPGCWRVEQGKEAGVLPKVQD
jgi:hypothetical protein